VIEHWTPTQRGDLTVHVVPGFADLGVDAFVTDRFGGVSTGSYGELNLGGHVGDDPAAVAVNRERVEAIAGGPLIIVRQVHSAAVADAPLVNNTTEADALVTAGSEVLAILVADCVPLVIADAHQVAVVHAGWRGLVAGVIPTALSCFAAPESVRVGVGPCVSPEIYQVGPEVADHFASIDGAVRPDIDDRSRLDLRAVVAHQLHAAGVPSTSITISASVTDGGEMFFSDRAERPCGRFALVARRVVR
jgi:polyphenol oxidase